MSKTEPTPGPWALDQVGAGFNIGVTDRSQTPAVWQRIARVGGELDEHSPKDVKYANARLIAAARDMFDLLNEVLEWDGILPHSKTRIRGVIDKATP